MAIIISIIVLVALISLYDYFSARNWQQVTSAVRNDVVFENRNKKYGAYVIRKDYNKRMILIMAGMIGSVGAAYAAFMAVHTTTPVTAIIKDVPYLDTTILTITPKVKPVIIPETKITPEIQPLQDMTKFTEIEIVDHEIDGELGVPDGTKDVGDKEQKGIKDIFIPEILPPVPPVIPTEITDPPIDVDEPAEYPGGRGKMYEFLGRHLVYPDIAREMGIQGKCYLRFVVDKRGEISNIKVTRGIDGCPECGKEAIRVISKMEKWKPGKIKGEPVNSYFDMPISFVLKKE